jgi:small-conductance mechanosensitive channel
MLVVNPATLVATAVAFLPRLVSGLVLLVLSLAAASVASTLTTEAIRRRGGPPEIEKLLSRLAKWAIIVLGTIAALQQVDFDVTSFLAGLGVVGFTLGFAFQDIAKNFIAGVLLLLSRPFQIGEVIEIRDFTGTVMDVTLRATTLRTFDGLQVVIPNADVYTATIVNYPAHDLRRNSFTIGLAYEEDITRSREVFQEALAAVSGVSDQRCPVVVCTGLADSWAELTAYYWFTPSEAEYFEMSSRAIQAVKEAAEREGISLPYPTQTIRVVAEEQG